MSTFKFIHAADLHLDVPIKGVINKNVQYNQFTFEALKNVVKLAKEHKPDCVLFVGDVWNHEDASLKARIALREACFQLKELGIKVYIAHGNHDPLNHNFQKMTLPDNVFLYGEEVGTFILEKNNMPIAALHGISHGTAKETRNLAAFFPQITEEMKNSLFQICLLHTSLAKADGTQIYAPCTIKELREKNPHYWALGHTHEFQVLNENPHIVYSGAIQGTHINEQNNHGVALVTLTRTEESNAVDIKVDFENTAPLIWKEIEFQIKEDIEDIPALTSSLYDELQNMQETLPPECTHSMVRIHLIGNTSLDKNLRSLYELEGILNVLNEFFQQSKPKISLKDIIVATKPIKEEKDWDTLAKSKDFIALILQESEKWEKDNSYDFLASVYRECPLPKQYRSRLPLNQDPKFIKSILNEAKHISMQILEQ